MCMSFHLHLFWKWYSLDWGRMAHICVGKLDHHWFRYLLVVCRAPSHYLNQCWNIVYWAIGNKLQWNFDRNLYIVVQESAFENVVWNISAILSRPQCIKQQIVCGLYILVECFDWLYKYLQPSIGFVLFLASILFSRAVIWILFTPFFNTMTYFLSKIGLWLLVVCVKNFC